MRVWGYERRLEEGRGGKLARECWRKVRERVKREEILRGWEEERYLGRVRVKNRRGEKFGTGGKSEGRGGGEKEKKSAKED